MDFYLIRCWFKIRVFRLDFQSSFDPDSVHYNKQEQKHYIIFRSEKPLKNKLVSLFIPVIFAGGEVLIFEPSALN